ARSLCADIRQDCSKNLPRASSLKPSHSGPRQTGRTGVCPYSSRTNSGTKCEEISSCGSLFSHANRVPGWTVSPKPARGFALALPNHLGAAKPPQIAKELHTPARSGPKEI